MKIVVFFLRFLLFITVLPFVILLIPFGIITYAGIDQVLRCMFPKYRRK